MTESSSPYRPKTLDPISPPPRNVGVPETSIAGGLEGNAQRNSDSWPGRAPPVPSTSTQESSPAAVTEIEAQKTTAAAPPTSDIKNAPTAQPARKSRLRARKAAMTLTPTAVSHLRELLDQPEPKLIRVGVKNKGCSGSAYHLEYVDKPGQFDEQVEQDGVKVLIDSKALIKVIGSEMDWIEDKLSARFTFRNPNISKYNYEKLIVLILTFQQRNNVVVAKASVSFETRRQKT
jgi:iron-sulfur cluster assembly accessory protein